MYDTSNLTLCLVHKGSVELDLQRHTVVYLDYNKQIRCKDVCVLCRATRVQCGYQEIVLCEIKYPSHNYRSVSLDCTMEQQAHANRSAENVEGIEERRNY